MDKRRYNIYFNTHAVSGICIAMLLFVVFFAGAFSFFRDDIGAWQRGKSAIAEPVEPDFNTLLDSMGALYNLQGRDFDFFLLRHNLGTYVSMSASKDTLLLADTLALKEGYTAKDAAYFLYYFKDKMPTTYAKAYDLGEFLYRLHFLAPLNKVPLNWGLPFGYMLAGMVAFVFLFALITGVFLHWDKIKSNFFIFRPFSKWKTVWTDMHTALGVVGFPFQFWFALTGIGLIANITLQKPFTKLFYEDDVNLYNEQLRYSYTLDAEYLYTALPQNIDLNAIVGKWQHTWRGSRISRVYIRNFQDRGMEIGMEAQPLAGANFAGSGFVKINVADNTVTEVKSPLSDIDYVDGVKALIYRIHFGDFGGRALHFTMFVLGMMGCMVIISGLLIWLIGRDKPGIAPAKRRFNYWACKLMLAVCMGMLPVTAFSFIMVKVLPQTNQDILYGLYFYSWMLIILFFMLLKNLESILRWMLLLSMLFAFFVPLVNGLMSGLWLWKGMQNAAWDLVSIDLLFLGISLACGIALIQLRRRSPTSSTAVV